MNDIKVSLTIALPGRVMLSKAECLKTMKKDSETVVVEDYDKTDKEYLQVGKRTYTLHIRKTKPATQKLNLGKYAYDYMIGNESPYWFKPYNGQKWSNLSKKQRLVAHLEGIAESLGGTLISYTVFD